MLRSVDFELLAAPDNLDAAIRARFEPIGGIDLPAPRDQMREPPDFNDNQSTENSRRGLAGAGGHPANLGNPEKHSPSGTLMDEAVTHHMATIKDLGRTRSLAPHPPLLPRAGLSPPGRDATGGWSRAYRKSPWVVLIHHLSINPRQCSRIGSLVIFRCQQERDST